MSVAKEESLVPLSSRVSAVLIPDIWGLFKKLVILSQNHLVLFLYLGMPQVMFSSDNLKF